MGKVFHVQSIFEENGDIDEVGCIDVLRSGGTWLWDDLALDLLHYVQGGQ